MLDIAHKYIDHPVLYIIHHKCNTKHSKISKNYWYNHCQHLLCTPHPIARAPPFLHFPLCSKWPCHPPNLCHSFCNYLEYVMMDRLHEQKNNEIASIIIPYSFLLLYQQHNVTYAIFTRGKTTVRDKALHITTKRCVPLFWCVFWWIVV